MSILNNIRLKTKLFAVVMFLILVSVGISGTVYTYVKHIIEQTAVMRVASQQVLHVGRGTANLLSYARAVEFLPLELTAEQRKEIERQVADEYRRLHVRLDQIAPKQEADKASLTKMRELLKMYQREFEEPVARDSRDGKIEAAGKLAFEGAPKIAEIRSLLRGIEDHETSRLDREISDLEADQNQLLVLILAIAGAGCVLGLLAAFTTIILGVTRPLMRIIETMRALAEGKNDVEVHGTERKDEIGNMAGAVEIFRENAFERKRLEDEMRREREKEMARQERIDGLIKVFRGSISEIRQSLDLQLDALQSSSNNLGRIAGEAAEGATTADKASRDASGNVTLVANAANELTSASREISTQVHKASESVTDAMQVAQKADQDISSLAKLAERIGAIVDIISSIAEQTNMLALNATIEAARAGEAGRSFAVVASEVKTLAGQTANATEEISAQVHAIQEATKQAVESIRTISEQVSEIQGRTTAIAAAVEEQEASTHEISRSISLASDGSEQVAGSVNTMVHSVDQTTVEAQHLRSTSDLLADVAGNLTKTVDGFLHSVAEDVTERRRASRRAIRQIGLITTRGRRSQTTILDISPTGLRIEAVPGMRVGDLIEVEWSSGERFRGRPVWIQNGHCGIELEAELPGALIAAAA